MTRPKTLRALVALSLLISLGGCAFLREHTPHWAHLSPRWAPVTPTTTKTALSAADGYYEAAAEAINHRDYARALDLLQTARAHKADDIRVLNAFGVVYDKLGRFDLSSRYYAQAKAIDPNSEVVNHNLAYSQTMQRQMAGSASPAPMMTAQASPAAPKPAPTFQLAAIQPGVIRLDLPTTAPVLKLTGRSLVVVDASGRKQGAEPVRVALAQLGWSAPRALTTKAAAQPHTVIRYPEANLAAAQALARTLPAKLEMVACNSDCDGIRLIVGADAADWTFNSHFIAVQRHG